MENRKFSIVESLRFGFYTVVDNILFTFSVWLTFLGVCLGVIILTTILTYFPFLNTIINFLRDQDLAIMHKLAVPYNYWQLSIHNSNALLIGTLAFGLILQIFYRYLSLGLLRIGLDFYDYKTSSLKQLFFANPRLVFKAYIASILYQLLIVIGTIFFIIPGIYFSLKYGFYEIILVDKNCGIRESFKESAAITKGSLMQIFGLSFILFFINSIAMVCFGIGIIVSIPAMMLAFVYAYRKLTLPSNTPHYYDPSSNQNNT